NPRENTPGKSIVIPERIDQIAVEDFNMEKIRLSYIENSIRAAADYSLTDQDERFLAEDSKSSLDQVHEVIQSSNH
ncbi:MAG: PLP-dependent lyase/thiolase, partial [Pseudomonadota bacterium]